ncbi:hypothetical protein [Allonocardiopsis opalescens]|uniref:SH3 domain-containing protein n=1 Tax=Allonocardiopsis opalescens TaxID=1144618 RepID=A0A2T0PXA1_9ACTN|nr:hypothetical protein [Allonocardiopsis opalescens]PRX96167.1 hypothetical protein CLV72_108173 [Allonocardiopsis opalescens]
MNPRLLAAVALTAASLLTLGAVAAPAAAAAAPHAPCGSRPGDHDSDTGNTNTNSVRMRTGSSTSCNILGQAQRADRLNYYCYTRGNDGATWSYARNERTGVAGWIRDDLLADGGSFVWCPEYS